MPKEPQLSPRQILYEDNHLLVVHKPAGIATMGTEQDSDTMARMAQRYIKQKYNKPGNVFIGVVSRLDRLVSGVLVLARTSKAASRLSDQIRRQVVDKRYLASVQGNWDEAGQRELVDLVRKNEKLQKMETLPAGSRPSSTAKEARLRVHALAANGNASLLQVTLLTGRKHQIRLQLADRGFPIFGDRKYGASARFAEQAIALHCWQITCKHPTRDEQLTFQAPPSEQWRTHGFTNELLKLAHLDDHPADDTEQVG